MSGLRHWLVPAMVLAGLTGAHVTGALLLPPSDGDLGWQHWLGVQILRSGVPHALGTESFAATGAPWLPQEWLFSTLLAAAAGHGVRWLFALFVGGCAVVALGCVAVRCARYGAHPAAIAFVLVFVDVAMAQSFGVRAQVVGWAMLAAFLLALELPGRLRWTAIAVTVLWANWHASAVLAPLLAAAAAAGSVAHGDRRAGARDALIALAGAVAVCATPFGTKLPLYALALAHSPVRDWIREWRPPALSDPAFVFGALPLMTLAAFAARRASWRSAAIAAPFAYLAFAALRNVPLAAIACAPLAATALSALLPSLAAFRPLRTGALAAAAVAAAFLGAGTASALAARGVSDDRPLAAVRQLAALPGAHRLLCENFAWCGPAIDTGRISVFVDGRADPFPAALWAEYGAVIHTRADWRAIVASYRVDALLVNRGGALDRAARADGWLLARDEAIRLLVKPQRTTETEPRRRYD